MKKKFKPFYILVVILISYKASAKHCSPGFTGERCEIECGLSFYDRNTKIFKPPFNETIKKNISKIVGGTIARGGSWPSICYVTFEYGSHFYLPEYRINVYKSMKILCGGTLIDRNTVLSAAHCLPKQISFTYGKHSYNQPIKPNAFYPSIASMYTVYLGLQDTNKLSSSLKMSVSRVTVHENFNQNTMTNDIALLKLSKPVNFNNNIQPACLPLQQTAFFPPPNVPSWAVGWGLTSSRGSASSQLRNVKLTIYDNSMCSNVYSGMPKNWNSQICSGEINGGKDTCQGDSGGPLYVKQSLNGKNKFVLAGITSYGYDCALPGYAGIYTRVGSYLDWIERNRY